MQQNPNIDAVILYADRKPSFSAVANSILTRGAPVLKPNRTRDNGELVFLLRSLKYLPWLRNIYLVVANGAPSYVNTKVVKVVRHRDFFPAGWELPTFNSTQIQSQVHRIDGLSERFLLLDDDFAFLRPVDREYFFPDSNTIAVPLTDLVLGLDLASKFDNSHSHRFHNCNALLPRSDEPRYRTWHHTKPLSRTDSFKVYGHFNEALNRMRKSVARNKLRDVYLYELLYHSIAEGVVDSEFKVHFRDVKDSWLAGAHLVNDADETSEALRKALSWNPRFLYVNDDMGIHPDLRSIEIYKAVMRDRFPEKSGFEI